MPHEPFGTSSDVRARRAPWQFFVLLCLAAAVCGAPRAIAAPDPYQIFANARAYWMTQHYPPYLRYTIAVAVLEGGGERVEHYDAAYDATTGAVSVNPVSDYQLDHPTYPSGMNVGIFFWRVNKPLPPIDFLGVPHLAPTYSFGMAPFVPAPTPSPFDSAALVAQIRDEFHDPNPRATATPSPNPDAALKQIATVVARNRDYAISLLGTATIDGHPCYHLALQPLHDPGRFRIRQAWIDERTYAPWQLLDALNFRSGPGTDVPWMIHFTDIAGEHYVSEEDAQSPMSSSGEIYTKAAVYFENLHAVDALTQRPQILQDSGTPLDEPPWPGGNTQ